VRTLANDLGINLHTVNKAYAVLRDEGYVVMRGRSGAVIADPAENTSSRKTEEAAVLREESLYKLALAHRARGGTALEFMDLARQAAVQAYGKDL
jgi:DNA-binding transcriptional regulator YhcF (GntR family)